MYTWSWRWSGYCKSVEFRQKFEFPGTLTIEEVYFDARSIIFPEDGNVDVSKISDRGNQRKKYIYLNDKKNYSVLKMILRMKKAAKESKRSLNEN